MPYVLYGHPRSGSCSVECALAEAGAEVRVVKVDLRAHEQREDAWRAVNPARKIPALELPAEDGCGGLLLTESAAILVALAERHPKADLLPPPASAARAQALRWLVYLVSEVYPLIEVSDYPERFAVGGAAPEAVREHAHAMLRERWLVLEAAIAGSPWLLPEGFSAADLHIATMSRWSLDAKWRAAALPRVETIVAALAERPAAGPVWRRHFPPRKAA